MADKSRRKQIRDQLRLKAKEEFNQSLPMSTDKFKALFDYLDLTLQNEQCSDDHTLTIWFLNLVGIDNTEDVVGWLIVNGGYCDCEVIANVEELFELS
jgi:hypothetical protein